MYQRFGIEVVTLKRSFGPCSVHYDEHLRGSYTALCNALGPYTKPIDRGIICYFPSTALLMESATREAAIPFIFMGENVLNCGGLRSWTIGPSPKLCLTRLISSTSSIILIWPYRLIVRVFLTKLKPGGERGHL